MSSGELKIVCFMCNWVFCDEVESAITQEELVPFDAKIVRVMCIGRIDPVTVLETFEGATDGILLVGCRPPDCHFVEGNLHAQYTVRLVRKLLALTGLEPERLGLYWFSPIEEVKLTYVLAEFAEQIKKLGVSPLAGERSDEEVLLNVAAAKTAAADFRLRVLKGREKELAENVNVYNEKISEKELECLIDEIVETEFIRQKMRLLIRQKPMSVKELAVAIKMKPALVLRHIVDMRRNGMVSLDHVESATPFYRALDGQ